MDLTVKEKIVNEIVKKFYEKYPTLVDKFGENGRKRTREDNFYHLQYLDTAWKLKNKKVFIDYSLWLNEVLTSRNVSTTLVLENFQWLKEELHGLIDPDVETFYTEVLDEAIDVLEAKSSE
ncbi:globin family protein [Alkalihalobacterium elongatum]|uniref:hypothetical protein n=1 Tax=Alkalihalobacterium elongatum TaxID=2675466 RepID=UPI001C1F9C06|nr:hypothetical protein [Alkalihalobacterium elongatum]